MKQAYFIFKKGTDTIYDDTPFDNPFDAFTSSFSWKKFKDERKAHNVEDDCFLSRPDSEYITSKRFLDEFKRDALDEWIKGEISLEELSNYKPLTTYYKFDIKKFVKEIWLPFFNEHFEIRKINYTVNVSYTFPDKFDKILYDFFCDEYEPHPNERGTLNENILNSQPL